MRVVAVARGGNGVVDALIGVLVGEGYWRGCAVKARVRGGDALPGPTLPSVAAARVAQRRVTHGARAA